MASGIERQYREVLAGMKPGDRYFELLDRQYRELQVALQLDFLDFDKFPKTEAEVKAELARQADRCIKFELHKHPEVKMAKGKFKDSFVALACSQVERFIDKFDIPVVVLGQVPPKDVYEAAGVAYYLDGLDVRDWPEDPHGYKTPHGLHLVWMDTGVFNLERKVEDVRLNLDADARGATEADGSGLYVAHTRILEHHFIDLPGTSVESDHAPHLFLFRDGPRVGCGWVGGASPRFGSALCGRN